MQIQVFVDQFLEGLISREQLCELILADEINNSPGDVENVDCEPNELHSSQRNRTAAELNLDMDRRRRCGFPEVIYGQGKSADQILTAFQTLLKTEQEVLATRVSAETSTRILEVYAGRSKYDVVAQTLRVGRDSEPETLAFDHYSDERMNVPVVAVVSAGTTDAAVFYEAVETLAWMQVPVMAFQDIGVAGPFRLVSKINALRKCCCVIAIAGMEGALASVLGGYLDVPVIAVPTSVGYGANLQGVTTLLSMLSSCASNVATVNVDAGFKAAYIAGLTQRQIQRFAGLSLQRSDMPANS